MVQQDEPGELEFVGQGPRSDYRDRCVHTGLESSLQGCSHWGSVVTGRVGEPHQLPRVTIYNSVFLIAMLVDSKVLMSSRIIKN